MPAASSTTTARPLTPKQAAFVREYLVDKNATQAAIRAGYSAHTAKSQGARLLTNADILAQVNMGLEVVAERAEMSAESVLRELWENHRLARRQSNIPASTAALTKIGDHLGMFKQVVETRDLTLEDQLHRLAEQDDTVARIVDLA